MSEEGGQLNSNSKYELAAVKHMKGGEGCMSQPQLQTANCICTHRRKGPGEFGVEERVHAVEALGTQNCFRQIQTISL